MPKKLLSSLKRREKNTESADIAELTEAADSAEAPKPARPLLKRRGASGDGGKEPKRLFVRKEKTPDLSVRSEITRINADPRTGLTAAQAAERVQKGWANQSMDPPSKTVSQIILSNVFTYFNLVFFVLAFFVIIVGSWNDLMFMPVVIINAVIGIVQELRAKRTLDKLSLLSAPKATVVRDGDEWRINADEAVLDDIVVFGPGDQIYAGADVLEGSVQVNESLITGESDEIAKEPGSSLTSGSFIVSGSCRARLVQVGRDSFVSRLSLEARKAKKAEQSEMMRSLSQLVKAIGIVIIPFGAVLFYNQFKFLGLDFKRSVVSTVGALVGMIPEGLYLLTSIALAVGVIRLAQKRTLVHDLGCIETLARVDVLCVDKTGTITEPAMQVSDLVPLCPERFTAEDIALIMADYAENAGKDNETMIALSRRFGGSARKAREVLPFTSKNKYSGLDFGEGEAYLLGAPEIILGAEFEKYREQIEPYSGSGYRVLLLTLYDGSVKDALRPALCMPLALILLSNKIRDKASETFEFFARQGVEIKVISGDNAVTVSNIAVQAGIANAEKFIDARTLDSDKKLRDAAGKYTVFGRVTPEQKKKLVQALKSAGHKVAMTGDGVNDVLALKEADCSIAMASGSDVAARVSQVVLLDSDFSAMPSVVMEGRRVINNIERAAALYLVKNIFSFLMAIITMIFLLPYPVTASQLSLVSTITIGIPSFFLALEPNSARVEGKFLPNVLFRALPVGLTNVVLVVGVQLFARAFGLNESALSTISAIILAEGGLIMLYRCCTPFNTLRRFLWWMMFAAVAISVFFLKDLFALSPLDFGSILILATLGIVAIPVVHTVTDIFNSVSSRHKAKAETKKRQTIVS